MNKVQIWLIHTSNCKDCEKAKRVLESAIKESNISCKVIMVDCEDKIAVNIAITNDISSVPGCVIGNGVATFQGENFPKEDIVRAIKQASL